jgi:integral membrane protein (TIGR01906 family)
MCPQLPPQHCCGAGAGVLAKLSGLLLALGLGAAILRALALRPRLHVLLQEWSGAAPASLLLTQAERLAVARALTAYLGGVPADLLALWQREQAPPGGASPRAQAHLRDVRAIFQWLRRLRLTGLAALAVMLQPGPQRARALRSAGTNSLVAAGALSLAALIDFRRLFGGYHRLFFRDENWRLDPQEDYLAVLYPEAVYRLGALLWSALWALAGGLLLLLARTFERQVGATTPGSSGRSRGSS